MTIKEFIWMAGILIAVGGTWGMTSQRINAMEKDVDRMETQSSCSPKWNQELL